ncbi:MAG: hypothetical protein AAFX79_06100 [Planctomycetota bacterium]
MRYAGSLALALMLALAAPVLGSSPELLSRLPRETSIAIAVRDGAGLRGGAIGHAVQRWMHEQGALESSRRAWGVLARRLGVEEDVAFDGLLGRSAAIAFARRTPGDEPAWLVVAAVDSALDARLARRTRAVPRRLVHGRAVLGLEEEAFLLATLPSMPDGRRVLAFAPAESGWLLSRTLAVASGTAPSLPAEQIAEVPEGSRISAFVRDEPMPSLLGPWVRNRLPLVVSASTRDAHVDVRFRTARGALDSAPQRPASPLQPVDEALMVVRGPTDLAVRGVLDHAGLGGVLPSGVALAEGVSEIRVVREGGGTLELTARVAVEGGAPRRFARFEAFAGELVEFDVEPVRLVRIRGLKDTPASRALFGPESSLAWTTIDHRDATRDLVLAVTPGRADGRQTPAVAAVLGVASGGPLDPDGFSGLVRPYDLWARVAHLGDEGGLPALAALFESVEWSAHAEGDHLGGSVVLRLR